MNKNINEDFTNLLDSIDFDSPNEYVNLIDKKLDILMNNMNYNDYISFIKNDKYINMYDNILGNYALDIPLYKPILHLLKDEFYNEVLKRIDKKIDELKINH